MEISGIEKEEGKEIREIRVGAIYISKNELSLKEIILKGNEYYYNKQYNEAIECYDKALEIDAKYALLRGTKSEQRKIKWYTSNGKPVYE
ncbi:MAG: tetratricopeptide repeat protein [Candidatus Nitrosopolaris sp.]